MLMLMLPRPTRVVLCRDYGRQYGHGAGASAGFVEDDDLDGSGQQYAGGHRTQPSFEAEGEGDAQDPVAFLRQKRAQHQTAQEQIKHFLGRQLVTAGWDPALGSNSVDHLSAVVVEALKAASYQESEWVQEVQAMASEGVLETFVSACVAPPEGAPKPDEPDKEMGAAFWEIFMGTCPDWYKQAVVGALILNICVRLVLGPAACAWCVLIEFIGTLAMATHCYPLQPGGLIVMEAYALKLASPHKLEHEVEMNIDILLLVTFMVACIHFLKNLLLWIFTNLMIKVESKVQLSVSILLTAAVMSAFMDALSVAAVLISVSSGVLEIYLKAVGSAEAGGGGHGHGHGDDGHGHGGTHEVMEFELKPGGGTETVDNPLANGAPTDASDHAEDIQQFKRFLRSILIHGAVGTAVGGCTTLVGEPQNLVIAKRLEWDFVTFMIKMAPITILVWPAGLFTCITMEQTGSNGFGDKMPDHVRQVLFKFVDDQYGHMRNVEKVDLMVQVVASVFLVCALCMHLTEVGFVGLGIAIIVTTCTGKIEEHDVAHAFLEAMPFVSLLVVFFGVVAIIEEQHIFAPIIDIVLGLPTSQQPTVLYGVNGFLSMVSDNVFVATIFIESVADAYHSADVDPTEGYSDATNMTHAHFEDLAVAINMGTNLPSCATPNGQAAFLFILTSAVSIQTTAIMSGQVVCRRTQVELSQHLPPQLPTTQPRLEEMQRRPHFLAA